MSFNDELNRLRYRVDQLYREIENLTVESQIQLDISASDSLVGSVFSISGTNGIILSSSSDTNSLIISGSTSRVSGSNNIINQNTIFLTGANGIILTSSNNTLIISQSSGGGGSGALTLFTESVSTFIGGSPAVGPLNANSFNAVRAALSDVHIQVLPKGTGGFMLGPATGQSRGQYSVDLSINGNANFIHGARATHATIGGGGGNQYITPYGDYGTIGGGRDNSVNAPYGVVPGGYRGSTKQQTGKFAFSSNNIDYSTGIIVYRGITTNGSTTVSLTVDGNAPATGQSAPPTPSNVLLVYLDTFTSLNIRAEIVARSSDGLSQAYTISALATNAGIIGPITTTYGTGLSAASVVLNTAANGGVGTGITVDVVGVTAKTIRWAATLYTTEVSFLQ